MEHKLTKKDWLYIAGAVASIIAVIWLFKRQQVPVGVGVTTDVPNNAATSPAELNPPYTNYNFGPLFPDPLPGTQPENTSAGNCGCSAPSAYGCAGASMIDTGQAYSDTAPLLAYFESLTPNFNSVYAGQVAQYAGSQYSGAEANPGVNQ